MTETTQAVNLGPARAAVAVASLYPELTPLEFDTPLNYWPETAEDAAKIEVNLSLALLSWQLRWERADAAGGDPVVNGFGPDGTVIFRIWLPK